MDIQQFMTEVVHKKPQKSKKWLMAIIGVGCVMVTLGTGVVASVMKPEIAPHICGLCGQVVLFLGALVGAYTTGQSFVDWKAQTNITTLASTSREEKQIDVEITERHLDVQSRAKEDGYAVE